MFNNAKKLGWETFWDSVKFTWDSTFVDALGPRDPIEIKPKSNTAYNIVYTIKPILSDHLKIDKTKVLMTNDSLMKVKNIAECSPWSILQYF